MDLTIHMRNIDVDAGVNGDKDLDKDSNSSRSSGIGSFAAATPEDFTCQGKTSPERMKSFRIQDVLQSPTKPRGSSQQPLSHTEQQSQSVPAVSAVLLQYLAILNQAKTLATPQHPPTLPQPNLLDIYRSMAIANLQRTILSSYTPDPAYTNTPLDSMDSAIPNLSPSKPQGTKAEIMSREDSPSISMDNMASPEDLSNDVWLRRKRKPTEAPRYLCDACSKSYATFSGLSKHKQFHCSIHIKKQFSCKYCDKIYNSLGALKMHIRTHTLPCKCTICGKAFSRPWLLQGHIRTHTGEKPYSCNYCGRAFADRSNLRAHTQTHSDVKKYSCGNCNKTFSRMSLLTKHEETCMAIDVTTPFKFS